MRRSKIDSDEHGCQLILDDMSFFSGNRKCFVLLFFVMSHCSTTGVLAQLGTRFSVLTSEYGSPPSSTTKLHVGKGEETVRIICSWSFAGEEEENTESPWRCENLNGPVWNVFDATPSVSDYFRILKPGPARLSPFVEPKILQVDMHESGGEGTDVWKTRCAGMHCAQTHPSAFFRWMRRVRLSFGGLMKDPCIVLNQMLLLEQHGRTMASHNRHWKRTVLSLTQADSINDLLISMIFFFLFIYLFILFPFLF